MASARERYGEAFWRAHHEAWQQSALNQREYCEAHGIPLKAFGNWRAKFKAEPQPPVRKLLYRRRGLSHTLSHSLSHMTYGSPMSGPIVPPAREGHRRQFSVGRGVKTFRSSMSHFPGSTPRMTVSSAGSLVRSKADLTALKCDFRYTPEAGHSGPWLESRCRILAEPSFRRAVVPSVLTAGGTP